jgi:uncharacterized protein YjbI with pentapeptide repeats
MINVMTSPGHGAVPPSTTRVAGRPAYPGRLTVRPPAPPPAPPSKREGFARSFAKAFYWQGWKTVGAVAASLVAICTAIVAIATFVVSVRTLQANTRSQTSDRFVKAIEQLGNDKSPDVRLGGIYGLEQLARDTPSDQPAVFDVLTAFVRGQVPAGTGKCADPSLNLGIPWTLASHNASPSADVQAAVDAIGRRDRKYDREDQVLDLSHTCLAEAKCTHFQLLGVSLSGADLRNAVLYQADLRQTKLDQANLAGAVIEEANLAGAWLDQANLADASVSRANLAGAWLAGAWLPGAWLLKDDLTKANLDGANLTGAHLSGANLTGATLLSANLTGAHLGAVPGNPGIGAGDVGFGQAGANLSGADLRDAKLDGADLTDIYYDASTQWPNGFRPPPSRPH